MHIFVLLYIYIYIYIYIYMLIFILLLKNSYLIFIFIFIFNKSKIWKEIKVTFLEVDRLHGELKHVKLNASINIWHPLFWLAYVEIERRMSSPFEDAKLQNRNNELNVGLGSGQLLDSAHQKKTIFEFL